MVVELVVVMASTMVVRLAVKMADCWDNWMVGHLVARSVVSWAVLMVEHLDMLMADLMVARTVYQKVLCWALMLGVD